MPEWFAPTGAQAPGYQAVQKLGRIAMDCLIPDHIYRKHGTNIRVRLMVIDKVDGDDAIPGTLSVEDLALAALALERPTVALPTNTPIIPRHTPRASSPLLKTRKIALAVNNRPALFNRPEQLTYQALAQPLPAGEPVGEYIPYRVARADIDGAKRHPTDLVESMAMGAVLPPPPTYRPMLTTQARAALSDAQLETIIYAGQSFEQRLTSRFVPITTDLDLEENAAGETYRRGFFLGDGTGAGKGRQVAGLILDQWLRGNQRHLWVSKSAALLQDARRDWEALGGVGIDIQPLDNWSLGTPIQMSSGILFCTYATLRSERPEKGSRLDQIIEWMGDGKDDATKFEGVIIFDEAHAMANAVGSGSSRGEKAASEQGRAGLRLQNRTPNARILYVSATGATDINNLAYATRLGLWGPGSAFPARSVFIEQIRSSGMAAMELVARDMKAQGLYTARALSFEGVEYDILEHPLTQEQIATYDIYAGAWEIIHQNMQQAMADVGTVDALTGDTRNGQARAAALSLFESAKQRFFSQVLLTLKLPSLIKAVEADLRAGHAVVVQLVSTAEAMLDRRIASLNEDELVNLAVDLSPREYVFDYLMRAFPVRQMREIEIDGKITSVPMVDKKGDPVFSETALRARDNLVETMGALPGIATALDEIIAYFGKDRVAEVTGRSRRLITGRDGQQLLETRGGNANLAETEAFMADKKQILLFSDAGGTGRSYHADKNAKNQRRRIHYLLEPGWRADNAVQGLGRTHRTHQVSAPLFRPVTTDVRGEKRFISTIARRLDSLGALTRGQRQTGGQNLFDPADNLESPVAANALHQWCTLLWTGAVTSISYARFKEISGLDFEKKDKSGQLTEDLPAMSRWLNRLLAFPINLQNAIFDEFAGLLENRINTLRDAGKLDIGMATLNVSSVHIEDDILLRTDDATGAETRLLKLILEQPRHPLPFHQLMAQHGSSRGFRMLHNARSDRIAAIVRMKDSMDDDGKFIPMVRTVRPTSAIRHPLSLIEEGDWNAIDARLFETRWNQECDEARASPLVSRYNLVTGLLLPIWNLMSQENPDVLRIAAADGRAWLGRVIRDEYVEELGAALGIGIEQEISAEKLVERMQKTGKPVPVPHSGGMIIQPSRVNGQVRLEIKGFEPARLAWYKSMGCFTEIVQFKTRLFAPDETILIASVNGHEPRQQAA